MRKLTYEDTIRACFVSYVTQAVVVNYAPLLFIHFNDIYHIPLEQITLLITFNFLAQLLTDFVSAFVIDKVGYRRAGITAHLCSVIGLVLMGILPDLLSNPFAGLLIAVTIFAVGGGLMEVIISPIVESCPTKSKQKAMSLLHSFYSWGHAGVILLSTLFFTLFGIENWRILAMLWALIPLVNTFFFLKIPLYPIVPEGERGLTFTELFKKPVFWLMIVLMICSGASEQAIGQWVSAFTEAGLAVNKTLGDLLGTMMFALCMALTRGYFGNRGEHIPMEKILITMSTLCVAGFLITVFSPIAGLSLVGCGICGVAVAIFWPGSLVVAAKRLRNGGTKMYALLALAGDFGCCAGPTVTGWVTAAANGDFKKGILAAIGFPLVLLIGYFGLSKFRLKEE